MHEIKPTASQAVFDADLSRMNKALRSFGAVNESPDGFTYIDTDKAPGPLLRAYRGLLSYGYANGLI
jgi:hypothetical protein